MWLSIVYRGIIVFHGEVISWICMNKKNDEFVEDVNSWVRGTHESQRNWSTQNPNDPTGLLCCLHVVIDIYFKMSNDNVQSTIEIVCPS